MIGAPYRYAADGPASAAATRPPVGDSCSAARRPASAPVGTIDEIQPQMQRQEDPRRPALSWASTTRTRWTGGGTARSRLGGAVRVAAGGGATRGATGVLGGSGPAA